jgi:hypothetical protein
VPPSEPSGALLIGPLLDDCPPPPYPAVIVPGENATVVLVPGVFVESKPFAPAPPAPTVITVAEGPDKDNVLVVYPPAPPPPVPAFEDGAGLQPPPPPPPATTTYSTVSLKVPGAVKVPEPVKA